MSYDTPAVNGQKEEGDAGDEDERKVFVGGLSWQSSDKDLRKYFEKFGAIEKVTLKTDAMTGESRGFGFILYEDKESVEGVLAEQSHTLNGKKIGPRRAKAKPQPEPILKIFIGGLDVEVTEEILRGHFEAFGTITEVILPKDKETNERRAFGFVKYESEEVVDACIASNDSAGKQTIGGKEYDIKKSKPKEQFGMRGGRGGFGGRGRGFGGGYGGGYGGYDDYYGGYGYGGGFDYGQDYYGGYGYGGPRGRAPRARGRGGRGGRGFSRY